MNLPPDLVAVIFDIGGTLVEEAPPGTPIRSLEARCMPRVLDDLRALGAHVRLAAATNTAVMTEADVRALLAPTGLDDLLEILVTSADVGVAKPDPAVLHVVLERLGGIDPGRALYIGNLDTDEAAAVAAGIPYAAVHPDGIAATIRAWVGLPGASEVGPDHRWNRPVPTIGDASSAADRAADPAGWRLSEDQRAGLYTAIEARRDVRRFRPDPLDDALVTRVLAAAHAAPSVGHSQPWRFVLIDDARTRERAALIADRERMAQAEDLTPDAARHLLDLQLEGIREAPLGIVVCCDRRVPAAGVLGRRTFPDADLWSCACAIQNLWLAARAEGLGVGWVTLFPPKELAGLCNLPDGVSTLGWLCIGWPDERPPAPGLERAGWSTRLDLADVTLRGGWPSARSDHPEDPPRGPATPMSRLRAPDQAAVVGARDDADPILSPPGSLGVLDRALDRVLSLRRGTSGDTVWSGTLVLVFGRHPVADLGVSAYPGAVTNDVFEAARAGRSLGAVAARGAGLGVTVIDAGTSEGNLRDADALSPASAGRLLADGIAAGRTAASRTAPSVIALGEVGIANTTVAAALACVLGGLEPQDAVGLGAGSDAAMVDRKRAVVAEAVARARAQHGAALADPMVALRALGGPEFAFLAGVCLGAAVEGAPIILDGLATSVAALAAVMIEPAVSAHLIAGHRSRETAHAMVLHRLGLEPLLDLRIRSGEGVGACLAANLVRQGLAVRRDVARTSTEPAPSTGGRRDTSRSSEQVLDS